MDINLERLERARGMIAYVVLRHGLKYAPLLERIDREVESARQTVAKARRILE